MKKELFSGTFFLIICILVTAAAAVSFMDGTINVFAILYAVSAWLIYCSAKSDDENIRGLKLGYGTTKGLYIVNWVLVGFIAVAALAVMFAFRAIADVLGGRLFYSGYGYGIGGAYGDYDKAFDFFQRFGNTGFVWCGLTLLVSAAALAVVNLLFVKNLLTFIRSIRSSAESGVWNIEKSETVSKWLFVLGILSSLGVLSMTKDGLTAFASAASGACMIVASKWIKHNVVPAVPPDDRNPRSEWYSPEQ